MHDIVAWHADIKAGGSCWACSAPQQGIHACKCCECVWLAFGHRPRGAQLLLRYLQHATTYGICLFCGATLCLGVHRHSTPSQYAVTLYGWRLGYTRQL
jgi:hypothetical protein